MKIFLFDKKFFEFFSKRIYYKFTELRAKRTYFFLTKKITMHFVVKQMPKRAFLNFKKIQKENFKFLHTHIIYFHIKIDYYKK